MDQARTPTTAVLNPMMGSGEDMAGAEPSTVTVSTRKDMRTGKHIETDGDDGTQQLDAQGQIRKYEELFRKYDNDGSGTIESAELGNVLKELGHDISAAELANLMSEIDSDGSGEIDFDEFMRAVQGKVSSIFSQMNKSIEESVFGAQATRNKGTVLAQEDIADPNLLCGLLHPTSETRKMYDLMQVVMLMYTLFMVPYRIAFADEPPADSISFWLDVTVDSFFAIDLFVQMHTYYMSGRTGEWVGSFPKIRARYFRSWFIVDFIAVFPIDYIVRAMEANQQTAADSRSLRMLRLARLLRYARLLKLMNLKRVTGIIETYQSKIGFAAQTTDFMFKILFMVCGLFAVRNHASCCFNHLTACMWIFIGRGYSTLIEPYYMGPEQGWWDYEYSHKILVDSGEVTEWEQYVDGVYFVMMTVTSVGYGDITPKNVHEKWWCYSMMFLSCFVYAYIIGTFSDIVASRRSDRNHFDSKMRSVFEFLAHVDCPPTLKASIKSFYNTRYPRKTLFDEEIIYRELPEKICKQLVLHRFERTVHHVPFFRGCSDDAVVRICRKFRAFSAMPKNPILERGELNQSLIILEKGKAKGIDGHIATTYNTGSFFGELGFLGLVSHTTMAVQAETYCDLYALRFADIQPILTDYPVLRGKLEQYARLRRQAMRTLQGGSEDGSKEGQEEDDGDDEPHHDSLNFADRLKRCSRAKLEASLLRAFVQGQLTESDMHSLGV